ncbi:restriction endonuclease subunit S [Clostridium botulinum]|uniref:restriction endonuclease subunit S n=1 Tax=Clostridium sp. ZBS20 TaxID=2949966 RepID=UPI00207A9E7F|nr:restriction endonuclease subunit S [Clostridium sp. ZBS20]MBN1052409.1 restriction endonuclease subunit S [Clostridium botulinum]
MLVQTYSIGDIGKVISGYAFKSKDFIYEAKDNVIPVIKIKNIGIGNLNQNDICFVNNSFLELNEKYHVKKNDILISLTGSHINQPNSVVGRVARSQYEETFLLNQRAGKIIIDSKNNICDKDFLYYYLSTEESKKKIINLAHGAANQANVSPKDIENIEIDVPNIKKQIKIAKILLSYDSLIENNLKRIKLLEESADLLYKEWFVNFKFPWYEKCEFVDGIPSDWSKTKVGEHTRFIKGKKPKIITETSNKNSVLYLLVDVLEGNNFLYTEDKKVPVAMENEVIMIMDGSRSGTIYKSMYGAIGSTMSIIRIVDNHLQDEYLYYYLKLNEIHIKKNNTGSAIPHANKEFIKDMDILIPSQYVIEKFSEYTRNISKQISVLKLQINKLKESRDILIPKLIMGEIEV